ncbi:uncharacterized protein G2W53_018476 [Senna tora]|uniref:Transmembrane protein n=1 Tax=Senna tora TaxID=362788 RepID=A0A834TSL8_9FABA|nr:uncharacterized protein G2W53_018476 [Senna tora]
MWSLENLWPFRFFRKDDLRASKQLVSKLSIPEHTKHFVYAIRDPETQSLIYILSALNLSERSAFDAECLIREVKPDAVVVQAGSSLEIQSEENEFDGPLLPTSSFAVIKRCFVDKIGKEKYESLACNFVLREIFGTSFLGHLLAARRAAHEVGSSFLVLGSPLGKNNSLGNNSCSEVSIGTQFQSFVTSLVPQKSFSLAPMTLKRFCLGKDVQSQMVKSLSICMDRPLLGSSSIVPEEDSMAIQPSSNYQTPAFAMSIYPLLEDLHSIFSDLPSIGKALAHVQMMLVDVNRGEVLDKRTVSEVYTFRIAVEALRMALNNSGLQPTNRKGNSNSVNVGFSELPIEDKSHALFAQALRSQTHKFKTVVAVVDAGGLAGLRKHWDTPLPPEVNELVEELITTCEGEGFIVTRDDRKRTLTEKSVVAVGAGATAVLGASSLTKVVPASTLFKFVTFKAPASLKFFLIQAQRAWAFSLGPSKVVAPGLASSGAKTSSLLKATVSAEKIRAVAHSIIASAQKTSISAMRTAFYEIMRKRKVRPIGFLPWATFGCSVGTCTGLLMYGDGIECAVESLPAAPSIASLGRGIQHLHEASQMVMQAEGTTIRKSIEAIINRLKNAKDQ